MSGWHWGRGWPAGICSLTPKTLPLQTRPFHANRHSEGTTEESTQLHDRRRLMDSSRVRFGMTVLFAERGCGKATWSLFRKCHFHLEMVSVPSCVPDLKMFFSCRERVIPTVLRRNPSSYV